MTQPDSIENDTGSAGAAQNGRKQWRRELVRELIILAIALLVGLMVLPGAIYEFGIVELGPYDGGLKTLWSFFGAYFRNLGDGVFRTWFLVASPYVFLMLLRLIFISWKRSPAVTDTPTTAENPQRSASPAAASDSNRRREPFVGS